jgi:hypothetical protein
MRDIKNEYLEGQTSFWAMPSLIASHMAPAVRAGSYTCAHKITRPILRCLAVPGLLRLRRLHPNKSPQPQQTGPRRPRPARLRRHSPQFRCSTAAQGYAVLERVRYTHPADWGVAGACCQVGLVGMEQCKHFVCNAFDGPPAVLDKATLERDADRPGTGAETILAARLYWWLNAERLEARPKTRPQTACLCTGVINVQPL